MNEIETEDDHQWNCLFVICLNQINNRTYLPSSLIYCTSRLNGVSPISTVPEPINIITNIAHSAHVTHVVEYPLCTAHVDEVVAEATKQP